MTSTDKLIRKYLRETKKNCPYALRKHLDIELKTSLIEFCDLQNDLTMEMIEKHFGNPKQYAAEYLSLCDVSDIYKRISNTKKVKIVLLVIAILFVIGAILTTTMIIRWNKNNHPAYVYTDVTDEEK